MKIGIDGGALSITDDRLKVGVYRVTFQAIRALQEYAAENNYRIYGFGRGERGTRELSRPNTRFVLLPERGFASLWQTVELIRHPVDVYIGFSQYVPWLPHILCDVKSVVMVYDVGFLDVPSYYPDSYRQLSSNTATAVSRARRIVTISEASKQSILRAYHVPAEAIVVAPLGVSEPFVAKGPVHVEKRPYILSVGSLKPGKNIPQMLRAFAKFSEQSQRTYEYYLVGSDYWLDPEISETIRHLGLVDRVRFLGYVHDEALASLYRGAFAFLSLSAVEGFGLPVLEAMACGAPVIISDIPALVELAHECAQPYKGNDIIGVSNELLHMEQDPSYRLNLIRCGKMRARTYSWRRFARKVLSACL